MPRWHEQVSARRGRDGGGAICGAYLEQMRGIALGCPCCVHVHPIFQALHLYFWPCTCVSRAGLVTCSWTIPTAHTGASQHRDDQDIVLCCSTHSHTQALSGALHSPTLSTFCVLLCLDPLCVALFVRPNGHPEPEQALPTARGMQGGPCATAGQHWPKTAGQASPWRLLAHRSTRRWVSRRNLISTQRQHDL